MKDILRRVGQRFLVGFDGFAASADLRRMIRDFGVGHVILFARNVDSPEQVAELVREVQSIARDAGHELPLMVSVDQEGGRVARMGRPWTEWPPLEVLGRTGSEELSRRMGAALAAELKACGVRLDFAPVVDVHTNPANPIINDRAFSSEPDVVGRLAAAMVRGLQDSGVAACAKHFPGHGDTDLDSHLALPAVDHSRSRLHDVELRPFRTVIGAGVATVMTAHVIVRDYDPAVPATLSPRIIHDLLRGELGFDGVVFSDDLEMKAVADHWRPGPSAVLAAQASCDILPVCASHDAQAEAMEAVVRAAESGEIPFKAMDHSLARIRRLKERFCLPHRDPDPKSARLTAGSAEWVAVAEEIAARGQA